MEDFSFNKEQQNNSDKVQKREIISGLPASLRNDTLKKYFNTVVDPWYQQKQLKKISGYIGIKDGRFYNPEDEFYVDEITKERNDYQLEPTLTSINNFDENQVTFFYQDLINYLNYNGSLTNNHNRLFAQEYYSWSPPIDVDKLINFSNYYWVVSGPSTIVITDTTNAVLDIIGKTNYTTTSGLELQSGMRIRFTNDSNLDYNNISFIVEGVGKEITLIDDSDYDSFAGYDSERYDTRPYDSSLIETDYVDYITIERNSLDRNKWSRTNRWFHKDIVGQVNSQEIQVLQAKRPIIEFIGNMQMYDWGRIFRKDISLISENDQILDIVGQSSYTIDGIELSDGMRILFTGDVDPLKNNRVWKVYGIEAYGIIGLSLEKDGVNSDGSPAYGEAFRINEGLTNFDQYRYFDGNIWKRGQFKYAANQYPLFMLYDCFGTALNDSGIYPDSDFFGSKLFSYKETENSKTDEYLGLNVSFTDFGLIEFINNITDDEFTYNLNFTKEKIDGYYFFSKFKDNITDNDTFCNDWYKSPFESKQKVINRYILEENKVNGEFQREFEISITPTEYEVYLNGIKLIDGIDYDVTSNIVELSLTLALSDNDVLEIKSWAQNINILSGNGYFEIPDNLQSNPNNNEIEIIKYNQILEHFGTIIENQSGFIGNEFGGNNWRNTEKNLALGERILNHSAPMLKLMFATSKEKTDIVESIRFSSREYSKLFNKVINKFIEFYKKGYDYSVPFSEWISDCLSQINIGKTPDFPFYNSGMINDNSYIPNTPASLGITRAFKPELFVDFTRLNPSWVIRCHDGSIIDAFDEQILNDAILAFENAIFDSILPEYKISDNIPKFDILRVRPGFFRVTDYTRNEWNHITQPSFERWLSLNSADYKTNTIFDSSNEFSWNYSKSLDANGDNLPGNWRGIYEYFFDTDRPHTHPWEMLGLSIKPTWWDTEYGISPYTGSNIIMWNDIENGIIKHGEYSGQYEHLKRIGLSNYIPVDESGNLKSPIQAGIVSVVPGDYEAKLPWKYGDSGPVEYNWKISNTYSFDVSEFLFLTKPAKFIEYFWESYNFVSNNNQVLYKDVCKRKKSSDFEINNSVVNGELIKASGLSQWISSYVSKFGASINENVLNITQYLNTNLAYKASGFTKRNTIRAMTDSFGIIPNENIRLEFYKSPPIKEEVYSAVIIQWDGYTYRILGYDYINQNFKYIPGVKTGQKEYIETSDGLRITAYLSPSKNESILEYDSSRLKREDIYNFLLGYQRYLEKQGWSFEYLEENNTGDKKDFRYLGKQFLEWSAGNNLDVNEAIVLSPFANKADFYTENGQIDNIQTFSSGTYSIVDKDGYGINSKKYTVSRIDNNFSVKIDDNNIGIYCLRLKIVEYEHVIIFDNITKFNDLIYDNLIDARQPRIRISIDKTVDWNGRPFANGFIIRENDIVENFETTVEDFNDFYNFDDDFQVSRQSIDDVSKHLIGYQDRTYSDNVFVDEKTKYEYYKGFIRNKGTKKSFDNILRSTVVSRSMDFTMAEEWAFLIGEYGNTDRKSRIEIQTIKTDFKTNPQIIQFTDEPTDSPDDNIISITQNDSRWVLKNHNNTTINQFDYLNGQTAKRPLPNAGYPLLTEVNNSIVNYNLQTFNDFAIDNNLYENPNLISDGTTFWCFIMPNTEWSVFRLCELSKIHSITPGAFAGDPAIISLEGNHDINNDEIVYINFSTETSPDYQGFSVVYDVPSSDSFTIEMPVETGKVFPTGEGPEVFVLKKVRFSNTIDRDLFTPMNGWLDGDRVWVDDNGNGKFEVYKWNNVSSDWVSERTQEDTVDIDKIFSVIIHDSVSNKNQIQLELHDPNKGYVSQLAERELYYVLDFDPAKYNISSEESLSVDDEQAWGESQTGRLWWDIRYVRYLNYEQSDKDYRRQYWGSIAPGTEVRIYEWTRSPVLPENWESYTETYTDFSKTRPSGTPYIDENGSYSYVQINEYDENTNEPVTFYYFWVLNTAYVPKDNKRKISALAVKNLLENPRSQNIAWFAPISSDSFMVSGIDNIINSTTSVLQIQQYNKKDTNLHKEWILHREKDDTIIPPQRLWDKMVDSLAGRDRLWNVVPDNSLYEVEKYGNLIRPRQTWFVDMIQARKEFFSKMNKIFAGTNIVDTIVGWDNNLYTETPQPDPSQYDIAVFNRNDRDALIGTIANGTRVLVEQDQVENNKWTLWKFNITNSSFDLIDIQSYRTVDFWENIDFISSEYNSKLPLTKIYPDIPSRDIDSVNLQTGAVVKVIDNGDSRYSIYRFDNPSWTTLVSENGTLKIKDVLWKYDTNDIFESDERAHATIDLIFAARTNILNTESINSLFYNMIHYVHAEQNVVDWAFKTSYVYGIGNPTPLLQNFIFNKDISDDIFDYLNESKPYHTKIRGILEQREAPMDIAKVKAEDWYNIDIELLFDRVSCKTDLDDNADPRDYNSDELTAADRIKLFYKPTNTQQEKVLDKLISRCEFGGTVLDGLNFYNFMAGYDSQNFDTYPGYDFDNSDIEGIYDLIINGGSFDGTVPTSVGNSGIIIDGNKFIQPEIEECHPEELVKVRAGDSVVFEVFTTSMVNPADSGYDVDAYNFNLHNYTPSDITLPFGGGPNIKVKDFSINNETGAFTIGQKPQNKQSVFVYLDGVLLKDTTDYSIDWSKKIPEVTLSVPSTGKLKITSMSYGGSKVLKKKTIYNTNETTFDMGILIPSNSNVFVVVDGEIANTSSSGNEVTILSPIPSSSTVQIIVFDNSNFSVVRTQQETASGGIESFTMTHPPASTIPEYSTTLVFLNGNRLTPPRTKVHNVEYVNRYFKIGKQPTDNNNVKVYLNSQELSYGVDFNIVSSDEEVQLTFDPPVKSIITTMLIEDNEFEISGDEITIMDGNGNPASLTAGDVINITTFSEDVTLGIRTEVFTGSPSGFYPLGDKPFDSNATWVSVNGVKNIHLADYKLTDKETGYDSEYDGYDMSGFEYNESFGLEFREKKHSSSDTVVITYFVGKPYKDEIGFVIFKDIFGNRTDYRISDENSTFLSQPLDIDDKEVTVEDATVLTQPDVLNNIPGVVFINGEKIIYWDIDTSVAGQHKLLKCLRGSSGTGINNHLPIDTVVRDAGNQVISGGYKWENNINGMQNSQSSLSRYLLEKPGTYNFSK